MKIYSIITFFVFAIFSALQYNDPDALWWIVIYAVISVEALMYFFWSRSKIPVIVTTIALLYALVLTTPGFIAWINDGGQSGIWQAMTDDKSYIEEVREFLGVIIAIAFQSVFVINTFRR